LVYSHKQTISSLFARPPKGLKMTVPCGGTGVSEENETLRVKSGEYESSDSGAFLLSVASQRSTTELL